MPYKDKKKALAAARRWYANNRETRRATIGAGKRAMRAWFAEYKSTLSCLKCGEMHPAALDFHHRDADTKRRRVSEMASEGYGKDTILEEIAKCDVLCCNCHRKVHYALAQEYQESP